MQNTNNQTNSQTIFQKILNTTERNKTNNKSSTLIELLCNVERAVTNRDSTLNFNFIKYIPDLNSTLSKQIKLSVSADYFKFIKDVGLIDLEKSVTTDGITLSAFKNDNYFLINMSMAK